MPSVCFPGAFSAVGLNPQGLGGAHSLRSSQRILAMVIGGTKERFSLQTELIAR